MTEDTTYNGWTNWSTWIIHHAFNNSEHLQDEQERMRRRYSAENPLTVAAIKFCVQRNVGLIAKMTEMSQAEAELIEWEELAESWNDDWFDTGRPIYGPFDDEPAVDPEPTPETKPCRNCGADIPYGRVVSLCDNCLPENLRPGAPYK
jgi:hypothetical protein